MKSSFKISFRSTSNHLHLHSFGCLCFPWLKPYTKHKLQPRSVPCIFVGYSASQYAFYCLDPTTNKLYTSWHITFFDDQFPYASPIFVTTSTPEYSLTKSQIISSHFQIPHKHYRPLNHLTPMRHVLLHLCLSHHSLQLSHQVMNIVTLLLYVLNIMTYISLNLTALEPTPWSPSLKITFLNQRKCTQPLNILSLKTLNHPM